MGIFANFFKDCGKYVWKQAIAPILLRFIHKPLLRHFPTDHDLQSYNLFKERGGAVFEYFEKVDMGQAHSKKIISSYKEFNRFINGHDFYFMNGKLDGAHINLKNKGEILYELMMQYLFSLEGSLDFLKVYPDDSVNPEIRSKAIVDLNRAANEFKEAYVALVRDAGALFARVLT